MCFINLIVVMFEKCFVVLEGVEWVVVISLGMVVIMVVVMLFLKLGDYVICLCVVFGLIVFLFEKYVVKFGVIVDFVDLIDLDVWKNVVKFEIKLFFVEFLLNFLVEVVDV